MKFSISIIFDAITLIYLTKIATATDTSHESESNTENDSSKVSHLYADQSDTTRWPEKHCSGNKQSPIDIKNPEIAVLSDDLKIIDFLDNKINNTAFDVSIARDGDSLKFTFKNELKGNLFSCPQFHFHIDESEHTFEGNHYFAEIHLVCYKNDFASLTKAVDSKKSNALAVIGFWVQKNSQLTEPNAAIDQVISNYKSTKSDTTQQIPVPTDTSNYFRYQGSLTTPGCNEIVTWTVFKSPVQITQAQADSMVKFSPVKYNLVHNNRKTQALNGRTITVFARTSVVVDPNAQKGPSTTMMIVIVVIVVLLIGLGYFMYKKKKKRMFTKKKQDGKVPNLNLIDLNEKIKFRN